VIRGQINYINTPIEDKTVNGSSTFESWKTAIDFLNTEKAVRVGAHLDMAELSVVLAVRPTGITPPTGSGNGGNDISFLKSDGSPESSFDSYISNDSSENAFDSFDRRQGETESAFVRRLANRILNMPSATLKKRIADTDSRDMSLESRDMSLSLRTPDNFKNAARNILEGVSSITPATSIRSADKSVLAGFRRVLGMDSPGLSPVPKLDLNNTDAAVEARKILSTRTIPRPPPDTSRVRNKLDGEDRDDLALSMVTPPPRAGTPGPKFASRDPKAKDTLFEEYVDIALSAAKQYDDQISRRGGDTTPLRTLSKKFTNMVDMQYGTPGEPVITPQLKRIANQIVNWNTNNNVQRQLFSGKGMKRKHSSSGFVYMDGTGRSNKKKHFEPIY
jgi:hypothetical protein